MMEIIRALDRALRFITADYWFITVYGEEVN